MLPGRARTACITARYYLQEGTGWKIYRGWDRPIENSFHLISGGAAHGELSHRRILNIWGFLGHLESLVGHSFQEITGLGRKWSTAESARFPPDESFCLLILHLWGRKSGARFSVVSQQERKKKRMNAETRSASYFR